MDVDPCMEDAYWLRGHAERLVKREHVNQPFPEDGASSSRLEKAVARLIVIVFDVEEASQSQIRILFSLADIDELCVQAPTL